MPTTRKPIRVVIADDHEMMRDGLVVFFQVYGDLELVGEAQNGNEAIELCTQLQPDVLLIELGLKRPDSFETTREMQRRCPQTRVIALASLGEESLSQAAIDAGAFCCLVKDVPIETLATTIRTAGTRSL